MVHSEDNPRPFGDVRDGSSKSKSRGAFVFNIQFQTFEMQLLSHSSPSETISNISQSPQLAMEIHSFPWEIRGMCFIIRGLTRD